MILMIDDEPWETESYVDDLKLSGWDVIFKSNVDDGLLFLRENLDQIKLLILDIMMPPGKTLSDVDTQYGLRTGVHLFRQIRMLTPDLPIWFLTNVSDEQVAEQFRQEKNCRFLHKEDFLPVELSEEITRFLSPRQPQNG